MKVHIQEIQHDDRTTELISYDTDETVRNAAEVNAWRSLKCGDL